MKQTLIFAAAILFFTNIQAQRKVIHTEGVVTSINLLDMGSFPQGYETCVDINADGQIDQDYTWVTVMVAFDGFDAIPCIAPSYMLPTAQKSGRLYTGCKVSLEIIKSGPRFGYPMRPRDNQGPIPEGAGAIKGMVLSING